MNMLALEKPVRVCLKAARTSLESGDSSSAKGTNAANGLAHSTYHVECSDQIRDMKADPHIHPHIFTLSLIIWVHAQGQCQQAAEWTAGAREARG
jgi:hypothetical protein